MFLWILIPIFSPVLCICLSAIHHNYNLSGNEFITQKILSISGNRINNQITTWILKVLSCYDLAIRIDVYRRSIAIQNQSPKQNSIAFFGDSIFNYWNNLTEIIPRSFNASFGGARTIDLIYYIQELVLDWCPSIIIIHIGGNDWEFSHETSLEKNLDTIETLIYIIQRSGGRTKILPILFFSPRSPSCSDAKWNYLSELRSQLIISRHSYIDISNHKLSSDCYLTDGLHLSQHGYKLLSNYIKLGLRDIDIP